MAATHTVPQPSERCNFISIEPRHGVITLCGYGIDVRVDRGHLILHDGIGSRRSTARFARIGHGIRRLVVIGSDGNVSLAALRWLADQDASFAMLDRDGSVLATTGPVRPSDARLRRAQALAFRAETGLQIARELLDQKLVAQERLIRDRLQDAAVADTIANARAELVDANSIETLRTSEAVAAKSYWSAWRNLTISFPSKDVHRVPLHWRAFGSRVSPLTGSPRLAVNPVNAVLNYLYALLESESRLALAALGLDPGLGVMHFDSSSRDSLASDLMEPIRPLVDAYVLDWITRQSLRREWFFEQRDGNCRLMGSFAQQLTETVPTWTHAVAPVAERMAQMFSSSIPKRKAWILPATRLTQNKRREGRGIAPSLPTEAPVRPPPVCRNCGAFTCGGQHCGKCSPMVLRQNLINTAKLGRLATHTPKAEALRAETMRRQMIGRTSWDPADLPKWLTEKLYHKEIQPKLARFTVPVIASALEVSQPYATDIRLGKRLPHPRHWRTLAALVGLAIQES